MDKQSKASELNAGIRSTIEQLANETDVARQSELFRNYLRTSAAFYDYSWHNQMLIWKQKPDATFVGRFNTWIKCGRYVRKGEKGIAILAPMFFKDKRQMADGSEGESKRIWFKVVYVFDRLSRDLWPSLCALDMIHQWMYLSIAVRHIIAHPPTLCKALSWQKLWSIGHSYPMDARVAIS